MSSWYEPPPEVAARRSCHCHLYCTPVWPLRRNRKIKNENNKNINTGGASCRQGVGITRQDVEIRGHRGILGAVERPYQCTTTKSSCASPVVGPHQPQRIRGQNQHKKHVSTFWLPAVPSCVTNRSTRPGEARQRIVSQPAQNRKQSKAEHPDNFSFLPLSRPSSPSLSLSGISFSLSLHQFVSGYIYPLLEAAEHAQLQAPLSYRTQAFLSATVRPLQPPLFLCVVQLDRSCSCGHSTRPYSIPPPSHVRVHTHESSSSLAPSPAFP